LPADYAIGLLTIPLQKRWLAREPDITSGKEDFGRLMSLENQ
jgi:hypothetical protein